MNKETIASITTPIGEGGIGVVQVSGPRSLEIVNSIFKGKKNKDLRQSESMKLYYGEICVDKTPVDEVIVNILRKGDSFTGEDLVEVNCHGGIQAVKKTLECIVGAGAKEVDWQELANRPLKNHEIDLIQKEALIEIPLAKTKLGVKVILDQYNGALSSFINSIIEETENQNDINQQIYSVHDKLEKILETATFGLAITSPQKLVIVGKPNVGKSTLINALLRQDRSIVHNEPGTTRDAIDCMFSIDGIPLIIVDTAGIRETNHKVESLGVLESKRQLGLANKIIFMLDSSKPIEKEDKELMDIVLDRSRLQRTDHKIPVVTVINKTDLPCKLDLSAIEAGLLKAPHKISALKDGNISRLEDNLIAEFKEYTDYVPNRPLIFNRQQEECISNALYISKQCVQLVKEGKDLNNYPDLLNDIKQVLHGSMKDPEIRERQL